MKKLKCKIVLLCMIFNTANAQLETDSTMLRVIDGCLQRIYNLDNQGVQNALTKIRAAYPKHPVNPMLEAMNLYWQAFPIYKYPEKVKIYKQKLEECSAMAQQNLDKGVLMSESTFFVMSSNAFIGGIDASMGNNMRAIKHTKNAYDGVKKGFKYVQTNPEFLFTTGLYNYYVERYALNYPGWASTIHFFLPKGDIKLGLKQMEQSTVKARFTRTEAFFYLVRTYTQFEDNPLKSKSFTTQLIKEYPKNPFYLMNHVEALILSGDFEEAIQFNQKLGSYKGAFFPYVNSVFAGIIEEQYHKNLKVAEELLIRANSLQKDNIFAKEIDAYRLNALARINAAKGNSKAAIIYYKEALKIADYRRNRQEAHQYLKRHQ